MKKLSFLLVILLFFQISIISQPCLPEGITFSYQEQIDNFQSNYPGCTHILGGVLIEGADIANLEELNVLEIVSGYFWVCGNPVLASLAGLESLTTIEGEFWIQNNEVLTDISALSALTEVGETMGIIYNNTLSTLEGLDNINPESIFNLEIQYNPLLSHCAVESICEYLVNPTGTVNIQNNTFGCNTYQEIEEACWTKVDEKALDEHLSIFPNPASGFLMVNYKVSGPGILIIDLFDLTGTKVKSYSNRNIKSGNNELEIDLKDLKAGIYFSTFKTKESIHTRKLVKL